MKHGTTISIGRPTIKKHFAVPITGTSNIEKKIVAVRVGS
jgi:hypothetical protein